MWCYWWVSVSRPQAVRSLVRYPLCSVFLRVAMMWGMQVQHTPRASRRAPRFPNTIREYRLKAGLSQRKLAATFR